MTDKPPVKQEPKKDRRKEDDPKVLTEVIADLDVSSADADVVKGASGHVMCANRPQGA